MGTKHQAKCLTCSHEFTLHKGGGMSWYQKICCDCGSALSVPRKAPVDFDGTMRKEQLIKYLADRKSWSKNRSRFEPSELAIVDELTDSCECGGKMPPEWDKDVIYRCPECKCYILQLDGYGILYD